MGFTDGYTAALEELDELLARGLDILVARALNAGCTGDAGAHWQTVAAELRHAADLADTLASDTQGGPG